MARRRIEPDMDAPRRGAGAKAGSRAKAKAKGRTASRPTRAAKTARRARRAARPWPLRALRFLAYWGMVAGLWGGIAVAGVVVYYGARLPSADTWAVPAREPVVTFVAADGDVLAQRGWSDGGTGAALTLDEMSPWLPAALIAIEDRRFRSHFGLDPIGLARAMWANARAGRFVQGGSTLTQQLAKNVFLSGERSLERKVQELLLAFWLEHRHTKDRILELYLNRVYFGHGRQGVEAASRRYFGHGAADLTLMEAAILAGSLKAPSRLNPESHPRDSAARAALVLRAMREQGVITASQEAAARSTPPSSAPAARRGAMPWAVDAAMRELRERVPDDGGGTEADVTVHTTIVPALQRSAAVALQDAIRTTESKGGDQGAVVLMDGTGAVRAIVGGRDYRKSQFDRATRARRQPGSAFKAFTFLAALEKGLEPASQAYDEPVEIEGWRPKNYDGRYRGPVTLEEAFAQSLNTVAAQIVAHVGSPAIKSVAERLGVRTELSDNLSLSLGTSEVTPLELTAAYAPFANGGRAPEAHLIVRVEGERVLYERADVDDPQVIDPIAYAQMSALLTSVVERGTGVKARLPGVAVGGKTGTSQSYRDAWFVGVVPGVGPGWVASVWIGADDGTPMKGVTGGSAPATAFARLMTAALEGTEIAPARPEDAIALPTYGPPPARRPARVAMPYATESRAAR